MYTLDASVIAWSFDQADEAYAVSQELIDLLEQRAAPVVVPRLLLAEVADKVAEPPRGGRSEEPFSVHLQYDRWRELPRALAAADAQVFVVRRSSDAPER